MPETECRTTAKRKSPPARSRNILLQMKPSQNSRTCGFASRPTISGKKMASRTARTSVIGSQPRHNLRIVD